MTLVRIALILTLASPSFGADHSETQPTTPGRPIANTEKPRPEKPTSLPKIQNQELALNTMKNFKESGDFYCTEIAKLEAKLSTLSPESENLVKQEAKLADIICTEEGFVGFTEIEDANERLIVMKITIQIGLINLMNILRNIDKPAFMMANAMYNIFTQDVAIFYDKALFQKLYPELARSRKLVKALIEYEQYASRLIEYYKKS